MSDVDISIRRARLHRLQAAVGKVSIIPGDFLNSPDPLISVACSRLGHDPDLHRGVCRFLTRSLLDCRARGATLLIADGSAIAPWAQRAAELVGVPVVNLAVAKPSTNNNAPTGHVVVSSTEGRALTHDIVAIALADRVDALYVRIGGTIERCLRDRVAQLQDASTRVAVSLTKKCAAPDLIAAGAIGWYSARRAGRDVGTIAIAPATSPLADNSWADTEGQWLIHCTRARRGPWPGETARQYRDSILLGDRRSTRREPIDALLRIIRSGRLVADATATSKSQPVVCFSALPVRALLHARCFRPHLGRWDYEPYGIAIRTTVAKSLGVQPVIYGSKEDRHQLPAQDQYRFHPVGTTYDWTTEREWRSKQTIELNRIDAEDIRVFVPSVEDAKRISLYCKWPVTVLAGRNQ